MNTTTTTSTEMKTFPAPLLRLILCGGGGLPPAYGPIFRADGQEFVWDGKSGRAFAVSAANGAVISDDLAVVEGWRLPLCDGSPWLDRLAMVAAWMRFGPGEKVAPALLEVHEAELMLTMLTSRGGTRTATFHAVASPWRRDEPAAVYNLTTLPIRFAQHPPDAALPLALYDLPEVAARVATAAG